MKQTKNDNNNLKINTINETQKEIPIKSILLIIYNIILMATCFIQFAIRPVEEGQARPNNTNMVSMLEYEMAHGVYEFKQGFIDFKPILRSILEMHIYVSMAEGFINYTAHLFVGGRIVKCLANIIADFPADNKLLDSWFGAKLLLGGVLACVAIQATGILIFTHKQTKVMFYWIVAPDLANDANDDFMAKQILTMALMQTLNSIVQLKTLILFYYAMFTFKTSIGLTREAIHKSKIILILNVPC